MLEALILIAFFVWSAIGTVVVFRAEKELSGIESWKVFFRWMNTKGSPEESMFFQHGSGIMFFILIWPGIPSLVRSIKRDLQKIKEEQKNNPA